jgi:hypothetical protein
LVFPTRKDISEEVIDLISGVEIVTSVRWIVRWLVSKSVMKNS